MGETRTISLVVNGTRYEDEEVEVRFTLADFLRQNLGLTGTHLGCEHGVCGACTILFNGDAVRSCLMLAVQADGCNLMTVEGLAHGDELHPLQLAFQQNHALQCGFCTPGILMSLAELLDADTDVNEKSVRELLSGHLCRCTGYGNIVRAALDVFAEVSATEPAPDA